MVYRSSYEGNHYQTGTSEISALLTQSTDASYWAPLASDGIVYRGGVSEVEFECGHPCAGHCTRRRWRHVRLRQPPMYRTTKCAGNVDVLVPERARAL